MAEYSIDDFHGTIRQEVEDAIDFVHTEFSDEFEKNDRYFNGEVDIPYQEGRSGAVATTVRNAVRSLRPSVMRVLLGNRRRLVKYTPSNLQLAPSVSQQEKYVHQLFWSTNGYRVLYDAIDESLQHKMGPVKTYWQEDAAPDFVRLTMLTADEVQFLQEMPEVKIVFYEEVDPDTLELGNNSAVGPDGLPLQYYDVECERTVANGRIVMEAIPYGEFFISRNATSVKTARVHGHYRSVTVAEAMEMGLDYDDWFDLDDEDPQQSRNSGESEERRGYRRENEPKREDVLSHKFLLTECYTYMDLEDTGYPQLYCVYMGGTGRKVIDYWRESESPCDIILHDPVPFSPVGKAIADITIHQQDVETSLLRGMLDNVHMANTPRLGANPSLVNFDDLMKWDIGHPFRLKGSGAAVQVVQTPNQVQATLPMLQWLEQDGQNKIGVTKASQGLDPNAMQSTDKDAVRNTIALAQSQVELAVRNIIETGMIPIFQKLLRLSIQHMDRRQVISTQGRMVAVDQLTFDPDLKAEAQVGLGTVDEEKRMMGLQSTFERQITIYQQMGVNNPFVTASHIYNTLEDMTEEFGLSEVSRYYNMVTPEIEAEFAKKKAEAEAAAAQAQKGQTMDPVMGLLQSEQIKAGTEKLKTMVKARGESLQLQLKAIEANAQDDLARDKMAQDRQLESARLLAETGVKIDQNAIKREQDAARKPLGGSTGGGAQNGAATQIAPMARNKDEWRSSKSSV